MTPGGGGWGWISRKAEAIEWRNYRLSRGSKMSERSMGSICGKEADMIFRTRERKIRAGGRGVQRWRQERRAKVNMGGGGAVSDID